MTEEEKAKIEELNVKVEELRTRLRTLFPKLPSSFADSFFYDQRPYINFGHLVIRRSGYDGNYFIEDDGDLVFSGGFSNTGQPLNRQILKKGAKTEVKQWKEY